MGTEGSPVLTPRPMRADARRNYERLLTEAKAAFAEHGADASLDDIARRAGVGAGTLYRHFPTREALQEAVYRDQVEALRAKAYELVASTPPMDALTAWLRAFVEYAVQKRGLIIALKGALDKDSELFAACRVTIGDAVDTVLLRAQQSGAVRADLDGTDLLKLVHAISVATEHAPDAMSQAERLLSLLLEGMRRQEMGAG